MHNTPTDDSCQIRCPRLGQLIPFSYCRSENQGLPCFKTLDCWYKLFLVEEYLRRELTPEQWERAFATPIQPKVLSLVEMIEQAQKSMKEAE